MNFLSLVMMPSNPPFGMVFACFMVAIMIGSSLYSVLLSKGYTAEETLRFVIGLIAVTMGICLFTTGPERSQIDIAIRSDLFQFFTIIELNYPNDISILALLLFLCSKWLLACTFRRCLTQNHR